MTIGGLNFKAFLDELSDEGARLAAAARRRGPRAPVSACPGWTVTDLTAHLGWVYRWVTTIVGEQREKAPARDDRSLVDPDPSDSDGVMTRLNLAHEGLLTALGAAAPDLQCWTIWPPPGSSRDFWIRRMVHETLIHRVDAEDDGGAGRTLGHDLDPRVAADGIDEMVCGFARRFERYLRSPDAGMFTLRPTDADGSWWIRISGDPPTFGRGPAGSEADADVEGRAGELLLLLWNRRTSQGLNVTGDSGILEAWRRGAHL
jgi:uncharacterized protein (TIGR03083 family)